MVHFEKSGLTAIGVDMVDLQEVECAIGTFSKRYVDRLFSDDEQLTWAGSMPESLVIQCALGFAAKEAVFKVLDAPNMGINWHDIRVVLNGQQLVAVKLQGQAADRANTLGFHSWRVSSALAAGKALAFVCAARDLARENPHACC